MIRSDNMENPEIITIKNEFGKEEKLEVIEIINIEKNQYAIVSSVGSEEAHAYRMTRKGNEIEYKSVGVGQEFKAVLDKFNANNEQG